MEFMYLDESGDCGSSGSKHIVLTLVCTQRKKELERVIVAAKKELLENKKCRKWLNRFGGEIKYYNFPDEEVLRRIYKHLADIPMYVYVLILIKDEKKIEQEMKGLIVGELFRHVIEVDKKVLPTRVIADMNFFNKSKVNHFLLDEYVVADDPSLASNSKISVISISPEQYKQYKVTEKLTIAVEQQDSKLHEALQATDLISGALFNSCEYSDETYVDILCSRSKVVVSKKFMKFM